MRRLLRRDEAPPQDGDGWSFRYVHETGHISGASDWYSWQQKIKEHRESNGLPPISQEQAEDQLCGTLPPDRCVYEAGDPSPVQVGFGFSDVVNWITAVAKTVTGSGYVSQEEAERRAGICVQCHYNTQASGGCGACAQTARALTPGMLTKHTRYDDKLKNCAICKCYLRILVHFPLNAVGNHDTAPRPDWCWAK